MNLWQRFTLFFYKRQLHHQLQSTVHTREVVNLTDARHVGIMFVADSTPPENVLQWAEQLRGEGKTVECLGYFQMKDAPEHQNILMLHRKNINWMQVPVSEEALHFAEKKFDLLLCLYPDRNLPLEYIAHISAARWRVGAYYPDTTACYDFMVRLDPGKDTGYMINQLRHFLNQIQYDSTAA